MSTDPDEDEGPFALRAVRRGELDAVLELQREAFSQVAARLGIDPSVMPPLTETVEDLEARFDRGTRFFSAVEGAGRIVGAARADEHAGTVEIGRLAIACDRQRRGIATALMHHIERAFAEADRFVVFTGSTAREPLALYRSLGYTESRREDLGYVEMIWLEKRRATSEDGSSAR